MPPARDDILIRLAAVLTMAVDLAESVADLNRMLAASRSVIDALYARAPALSDDLRGHTRTVRARLEYLDARAGLPSSKRSRPGAAPAGARPAS